MQEPITVHRYSSVDMVIEKGKKHTEYYWDTEYLNLKLNFLHWEASDFGVNLRCDLKDNI